MHKILVFILVAVVSLSMILSSNDGGATTVATQMGKEAIKGDIVEISGKGMYYKNKYGSYPVHSDNIYNLSDGKVHESIQVFERFFDKAYLEDNVKLVHEGELKNKGVTYELASKKTKYFIDVKTGKVLVADLMDEDADYMEEVTQSTGFKVVDTVTIIDSAGNEMTPINGSFSSGSTAYFYGGGAMMFARRDELSNEITNLDAVTEGLDGVSEILYIQDSKAGNKFRTAVLKSDGVHILDLKIK